MSDQNSEGCKSFEDETIQLKPGMIPDTYSFKCPGNMCDKNNNQATDAIAAPQVRQMPKTDPTKCPPPPPKIEKTVEQCDDKKPVMMEDNPPPVCLSKLPETQNFKCIEDTKPEETNKSPDKQASSENNSNERTCRSSGAKRNCKCGTPVAPMPKARGCGCSRSGGATCGPNTSCEVIPLTMKRTR